MSSRCGGRGEISKARWLWVPAFALGHAHILRAARRASPLPSPCELLRAVGRGRGWGVLFWPSTWLNRDLWHVPYPARHLRRRVGLEVGNRFRSNTGDPRGPPPPDPSPPLRFATRGEGSGEARRVAFKRCVHALAPSRGRRPEWESTQTGHIRRCGPLIMSWCDRRYCGSTSMKPTRPGMLPLKKIRFGLVGSMSMRRGSDSASGSANSIHSLVLGSKRAIMSTWCWLTQM